MSTAPVVREHTCDDGTPFPVTFESEELASRTWLLEAEHSHGAMTPLADSVARVGRPGAERAYAEAGLTYPSWWQGTPRANGFAYYSPREPDPDEITALFTGCAQLVETHGSALGVWLEHSLPRTRRACGWLQAAPDDPVATLAELEEYALHHTMVSSMVASNDVRLVEDVIRELVPDTRLTALELAQGYENETLRADQALWELAQAIAANASLSSAIAEDDADAAMASRRASGVHAELFAAVDAFLEVYGWRATMWTIDDPCWREPGSGFWTVVRQLVGTEAPAAAVERAAARRDDLARDLLDRLPDDGTRARFLRRVDRLASYVPVREDRALWQLIACGSLRHAVLARARAAVASGAIDDVDDLFLLLPDEIDERRFDRGLIAERRAEHAHWSSLVPPLTVGAAPDEPRDVADGVLRGVAASKGTARGRACVVQSLADADRLEPGDVLVCQSTAPPWTPLFAVASAVVIDGGDLHSHAAIASREYGIPCVAGTGRATTTIPDGTEIVVDGTAGTVTLV